MNKLLPRFFTRLYTAISLAICASVALTVVFMEDWQMHDDNSDFVADVSLIYQVLEHERAKTVLSPKDFYQQLQQDKYKYPFEITWWEPEQSSSIPCDECQFAQTIKDVDVYYLNHGKLLSIHQINRQSGRVILQDHQTLVIPEHLETQYIEEQNAQFIDIEEAKPFIIFGMILLTIGIIIYIPIRQLQRQISQLDSVNHQFGLGNLTARADDKMSEPLRELAHSFNKMAQEISDTVTENQIFAQAVPHELRTPLSRIQLASGILRSDCSLAEQQELLDDIDQYIEDIDKLCSQVITFSQVNGHGQSGQVSEIKLKDFLSASIARFPNQQKIAIKLVVSDSLRVINDCAYLRLVIDNLIKNSINHAASEIIISAASANDRDNSLINFCVEDDGAGIDEADYDTIFIAYARLDKSRSRKTGGLGLGLAIAQKAAKRLNSKIIVGRSALGGAKFILRL